MAQLMLKKNCQLMFRCNLDSLDPVDSAFYQTYGSTKNDMCDFRNSGLKHSVMISLASVSHMALPILTIV